MAEEVQEGIGKAAGGEFNYPSPDGFPGPPNIVFPRQQTKASKAEEIMTEMENHDWTADGGEEDWCIHVQKRVANGSDGLWLRLGPESDGSCRTCLSIRLNPVVFVSAAIILFSLVAFCAGDVPGEYCLKVDDNSVLQKKMCYRPRKEFDFWCVWITDAFSWLYIATQDCWIIFAIVLYFSKYASLVCGRATEKQPEYDDVPYIAMIFTCGVATGLFFFAASEPIYYYSAGATTRYYNSGVVNDGGTAREVVKLPYEKAQWAETVTFYHWGLHAWVVYSLVAILLAFLHFRKGLPLTMKTCFYPLLGQRIYGLSGDILDMFSTAATTMGVCTSLGLGVTQLHYGLKMLNGGENYFPGSIPYFNKYNFDDWKDRMDGYKEMWEGYQEPGSSFGATNVFNDNAVAVANNIEDASQQICLIWVITGCATISVLTGVGVGILTLAITCFFLGMFIITYIWMMDDTWFITNFFFQTLGHYCTYVMEMGWYTSAFERAENGVIGGTMDEGDWWQRWWTIFYWGWWIAWCPFVGLFLARVSRGRTIRSILNFTIFIPVLYNFVFLEIWGAAALKMEMVAEAYGLGCAMSDVDQATFSQWQHVLPSNSRNICRQVRTHRYTGEPEVFCSQVTRLSCYTNAWRAEAVMFPIIYQYADLGKFMCVICMITLTLYFVASSDSGSMVDDMVTANGLPEPPLLQRWWWAMTEGAAATVLLAAGPYCGDLKTSLKALRELSIAVGLPLTFLVCLATLSLWRAVQYEMKDRRWNSGFKASALDIGITLYRAQPSTSKAGTTRKLNFGGGKWDGSGGSGFNCGRLCKTIGCILVPPIGWLPSLKKVSERRGYEKPTRHMVFFVAATVCFYLNIILGLADIVHVNTDPFIWGSCKGNCADSGVNDMYKTSTRYGWYNGWTNDVEVGKKISMVTTVDVQASEVTSMTWTRPTAGKYEYPANMYSPAMWGAGVDPDQRVEGTQRLMAIGWFLNIFGFTVILAWYRSEARLGSGIAGNLIEDYLLSIFCYPMVIMQINEQMELPLDWSGKYYVYGSEAHQSYEGEQAAENTKSAPTESNSAAPKIYDF